MFDSIYDKIVMRSLKPHCACDCKCFCAHTSAYEGRCFNMAKGLFVLAIALILSSVGFFASCSRSSSSPAEITGQLLIAGGFISLLAGLMTGMSASDRQMTCEEHGHL